jgi:hypothetical protein
MIICKLVQLNDHQWADDGFNMKEWADSDQSVDLGILLLQVQKESS